MEVSSQIIQEIKKANKILIISHVNPDGDTLGSMCALKLYIGEKADMLVQTRIGQEIPEIYEFLPGIKNAKTLRNVENIYDKNERDALKYECFNARANESKGRRPYDLVITVDIASIERMVLAGRKIFENAKLTINIDHHITNNKFGKINLIDPSVSSCGELLYNLFVKEGIEITKEIADCFYVAIMTDTGGFRYENTTTETLTVASRLLKFGANGAELAKNVYDSKSKAMVMFQAYCVSNTKFIENDKIAYTIIKNADMEKFGAKHEHTEGICETIRSIKTVEIACVIKENDNNTTKVSLRSKNVDSIKITDKFNGGGHTRSAGCTINKPVEIAVELLLEQAKKVISEQSC